ncbi:MAG: ATP-binding protein, partial [Ornithinimicrobium sp.]
MDARRSVATTTFVERVVEQAAISDVIGEAADGRAGALLVWGDAGVGKTALMEHVCSRAGAGVIVVSGGCLPLSAQTVPFLALISATRSADPGLAPPAGLWEAGRLATRVPVAFDQWLSDLCRKCAVVLTIDDLHWADQSTLDVLMYVLAGPADRPLAVIATVRRGDVGELHPLHQWLAHVRRLPRVNEVDLGTLDRVGTAEQVAGLMQTTPHQSLIDDVFARSRGNAYLNRLM